LKRCVEPKQFHDVVGYYNRFDVFSLTVNRKRHHPVTFVDVEEFACPNSDEVAFGEETSQQHWPLVSLHGN